MFMYFCSKASPIVLCPSLSFSDSFDKSLCDASSASAMSLLADWDSLANKSVNKCKGGCLCILMKLQGASDLSHADRQQHVIRKAPGPGPQQEKMQNNRKSHQIHQVVLHITGYVDLRRTRLYDNKLGSYSYMHPRTDLHTMTTMECLPHSPQTTKCIMFESKSKLFWNSKIRIQTSDSKAVRLIPPAPVPPPWCWTCLVNAATTNWMASSAVPMPENSEVSVMWQFFKCWTRETCPSTNLEQKTFGHWNNSKRVAGPWPCSSSTGGVDVSCRPETYVVM